MPVVDISDEIYECPHCKGYIKLEQNFGTGDYSGTESHVLYHVTKRQGKVELKMVSKDDLSAKVN